MVQTRKGEIRGLDVGKSRWLLRETGNTELGDCSASVGGVEKTQVKRRERSKKVLYQDSRCSKRLSRHSL